MTPSAQCALPGSWRGQQTDIFSSGHSWAPPTTGAPGLPIFRGPPATCWRKGSFLLRLETRVPEHFSSCAHRLLAWMRSVRVGLLTCLVSLRRSRAGSWAVAAVTCWPQPRPLHPVSPGLHSRLRSFISRERESQSATSSFPHVRAACDPGDTRGCGVGLSWIGTLCITP